MTSRKAVFMVLALSCATILFGCAAAPVRPVKVYTPAIGEKAANAAVSMIGKPYKYRGVGPAGFDCSGLVRYSYLAAGLEIPHGTKELVSVTRSVELGSARKGDLLFFNEKGKKYSHVGIFLDGYLFVHASGSGRKVRKDSLQDPHWKQTFGEARRFP